MKTQYDKQAEKFMNEACVKMSTKFMRYGVYFQDDKDSRGIFKVTFKREGKQFSLNFGQSINDSTRSGDNPPSAYSVLACLTKYDPGTFENFCSEFV